MVGKIISRIFQIIAIFVLLGIFGGGLFWAYSSNLLPIHPQIDVPSSFDNSSDSQGIKLGINTIMISQNELPASIKDNVKPVTKGQYPDIALLLPMKLNGPQDIQSMTLYGKSLNWMNGTDENTAYGKEFVIAEQGTEIIVPVDNAEIFQILYSKDRSFRGAVIKFKGPDQVPYELSIEASGNQKFGDGMLGMFFPSVLQRTEMLDQAPILEDEKGYYLNGDTLRKPVKGLSIPVGTPIIKTSFSYARVKFCLCTLAPNISNYKVDSSSWINFDFKLMTIKDRDGIEKVAIIASP